MADAKPIHNEGVESGGRPIVDPTKNVLDLVEAANKRQDDLRSLTKELFDAQIANIKEIAALRAAHAETLRVSDLNGLAKTREVDVNTANASAAALATAVTALQSASDKNAEAIRNQMNSDRAALAKQVTDTAATVSAANDNAMRDVNNRIAELQKSNYQGAGRSSVADPMMAEWMTEMRALVKGQDRSTGKSEGMDTTWKLLIAAVGLLTALNALGVFNRSPATPAAGQVIYVPAPAGALLPSTPPATVPR